MSARADYKLTDIGEIPEDWEVVRIGQVCEVGTGGTPSTAVTEYYENGNIRWMKSADVKGPYVYDVPNRITGPGLANSNAVVHPPGSVMMAMSGRGKTRGSTAVLAVPCTCSQSVAAVIPDKDRLSPEFLHYDLEFRYEETRNITGSYDRSGLNLKLIRDIKIPRPRLAEQQKIAGILLAVDFSLQKTDEIIAKTQRLKKGLMQQLLTRGIGHTKFKQTEIGEIPEEWEGIQLGDVLTVCQYGLSVQLHERGRFPILRMNNFEDGLVIPSDLKYADINPELFHQFGLQKGDLLFNRTNSYDLVGKIGVFLLDGDYTFASYLIRLQVDSERADPLFINYYLNTGRSQNLLKSLATRGVSQSNINATNLKTIGVSLPPLEEQRRIVSIISSTHDKVVKERQGMAELQKLKKGLMQVLLTGKMRVKVG
jgi:type I restriction enzyme S subunit